MVINVSNMTNEPNMCSKNLVIYADQNLYRPILLNKLAINHKS